LNLERELDGSASEFQILGFQPFEQFPVVTPFPSIGIGSRAGSAGPRELVNRSGFLPVVQADASYLTH
jgi:hypothetical protein